MNLNTAHSALIGLAVGDALGVPVEFKTREYLKVNPVTDMLGYGSHNQPQGTWSDDSSLTFCLAEMLIKNYNLKDLSNRFIKWYKYAYWTANKKVFDVGITTAQAIQRLSRGEEPICAGGYEESENGNGSLMRILPLVFYLEKEKNIEEIFSKVKEISCITHAHFRSVFSCFIYIIYSLELLKERDKQKAYQNMQNIIKQFIKNKEFNISEIGLFDKILNKTISDLPEEEIKSSGYVVHSIEASLWCLLTTNTYEESVLKAVNLGEDTDTTAAIVGGLAGILYGFNSIPKKWINQLARKEDIIDLCDRLEKKYFSPQ